MSITIQTREEILNDLRAFLRARQPNIILSVDTDEGALLESLAEGIYGLQVLLRAVENDVYATTAVGTALDEHAKTRLATDQRHGATTARGISALRVTSTSGSVIPAGEPLTHADGTQYETEDEVTTTGTDDINISSVTTGTVANKDSGESIQFDSPPSGVNTIAVLVADVDGAVDEESDEELRTRLLQAYQNPPAGGRGADYWAWAMEVTGIASAYIYEVTDSAPNGPRGKGTVDIAVLLPGSGSARVPSAAVIADVQDNIDDNYPIGAEPVVETVVAETQAVDVQIEVEVGYEFDWEGTQTVSSWASPIITLGEAPVQSLQDEIDDEGSARIMCAGEVMTAVAYTTSPDTLTISPVPTATPTGTIYPAGPLTQTVLDAIQDLFDALGPGRGITASTNQHWEDELKLADLFYAIMGVTGVDNCVIVTPGADVTPSTTYRLLIASTITVRPA